MLAASTLQTQLRSLQPPAFVSMPLLPMEELTMFRIDRQSNALQPLKLRTFSELGFRERAHLQEWIAKNPSCLGEELLIIQKEFAGFSDTNERLDLLAIDKEGRLVIIENKLDDTGRDVVWQALKYASYCSKLSTENIRKIYQDYLTKIGASETAEDKLVEFLECDTFQEVTLNKGISQRVILIAANFRKEVTSTIIWLMNFNVQVQCFKVTPYSMADELFLNLEQIIPTKDAEDYVIGLAAKAQDELTTSKAEELRHKVRREFWTQLLASLQSKTDLYSNVSPSTYSWIGAGTGVGGVGLNFSVTQSFCRAELYIDRKDQTLNKEIFDFLRGKADKIEADFGGKLVWERIDGKRASRIKAEGPGDVYDKELWPTMIDFMVDAMMRLEVAMKEPLREVQKRLKGQQ